MVIRGDARALRTMGAAVLAVVLATALAAGWRAELGDKGSIAFFGVAITVVTVRYGPRWGLAVAVVTSLIWDYAYVGPVGALDKHLVPILAERVLYVLGLWVLIGRNRRTALAGMYDSDDPEERVLREAVEDMGGWISRLPETSPWRPAFLAARVQIASSLLRERRPLSLVQIEGADPQP